MGKQAQYGLGVNRVPSRTVMQTPPPPSLPLWPQSFNQQISPIRSGENSSTSPEKEGFPTFCLLLSHAFSS